MKQHPDRMQQHFIICGLGGVGLHIAHELAAAEESFVVIDRDEDRLSLADQNKWPYIHGDVAIDESLLRDAGIPSAKSIIIALGTDADVIFTAVSARALNPDISIIARASNPEAADKLRKIGIDDIAMPHRIGGYHMASLALRPTVVEFLDTLVDNTKDDLALEEFHIYEGNNLIGSPLSALVEDGNLTIAAVRQQNGEIMINPQASYKLLEDDRLIAIGPKNHLILLAKAIDKQKGSSGT